MKFHRMGNVARAYSFDRLIKSILIFLVSFIFVVFLLNYSFVYWDGWVVHGHDYNSILFLFKQLGGVAGYYYASIHTVLGNIGNGVFSYRLLMVLLLITTSLFIYKICYLSSIFNKNESLYISALFLFFPFLNSKISIIVVPYYLSTFLFFLGFYLVVNSSYEKSLIRRILVNLIFFLSFFTNSYISFYLLVLIYLFYQNLRMRSNENILFAIIDFIFRYFDFLSLPILFILFKFTMMVPSGFYEGYNDLGHMEIGSGINALIQSIEALYLGIIHLDGFEFYIYALSLLLAINLILSAREIYLSRQIKVSSFFRNLGLILLGVGLIALALFPYAFVGKIPVVSGWNDRHFLLVPLGFAIVILFMAKLIYWGREIIVSLAVLGIVALFSYNILLSIYSCLRDGIYQESIMEEFKSNKVFSANNTFLILNKSDTRIFCHDRHVHYYEWNALLRQVYPEANKSINNSEIQFEKTMETRFLETFNAKNYVYSEPTQLCFNTRKIGLHDIFSMYFDKNFNYNYVQFSLPEKGAGNKEVCK